MKIIQIAGYKNSGKTTFASLLIEKLTQSGFQVASLKHHGHGGAPIGIKSTDSEKHRSSGAFLAGVEGDGVFQLSAQNPWRFSELTAIYEWFGTEVLIVEGFKKEPYPKIVTIGRKEDLPLLDELTNIQAVLTAIDLPYKDFPYPVFTRNEAEALCKWVCAKLQP